MISLLSVGYTGHLVLHQHHLFTRLCSKEGQINIEHLLCGSILILIINYFSVLVQLAILIVVDNRME
jgi:hypothetical protein